MDFSLKFYVLICTVSLFDFSHPHSLSSDTERCSVIAGWGTYRGNLSTSVLKPDVSYCSYRDIRYGEPVQGGRRFGKPMLAKPQRSRVFNATEDRVVCSQPNSETSSEDCLFLNVFTPQIDGKSEQPARAVIVYIPGGGYIYGSKTSQEFSPDYLLPHDVILVTINYRLNVFGFLNLGIPECNGNMGLRDQIVALEWVQKNIASFGGDPKNVTLMGQSAAGISVYLLQLSPLARGLFSKVIIESAISTGALTKSANFTEHHSIEFAKFLGFKGDANDRHSVLRFLRDFKAADLANGYRQYADKLAKNYDSGFFYMGSPLWPYIDSQLPDAVFPSTLDELGKSAANISCLVGYNDADAIAYSLPYDPYVFVDYVSKRMDVYMSGVDPVFAKNKQTLDAVIANVTKYYFSGDSSKKLDDTVRLVNYLSFDDFYKKIATFRPSYDSNKIWIYEFRYTGGFQNYKKSMLRSHANEVKGASHSAELEYLFYASMFFPHGFNATGKELEIIHKMSTLWTNFVKFGNPNSPHDDIELVWEPTSQAKSNYLQIDETISFIPNKKIQQKEREFFDELRQWAKNNN